MAISQSLLDRALKVIPGGVNSPVRAFTQVGGTPRFIRSGSGALVTDIDGNSYIDFVGSWGPIILGHANPLIYDIITQTSLLGTSFGAPTEGEVIFAELLCSIIPGLEMVRCVSSGTEAAMSAIRLARAFTGRNHIIKFDGCYHGHADMFLVSAGSGLATQGISSSPGVPPEVTMNTLSVPFNDIDLLEQLVQKVGTEKIAVIVIEPVAGNMGLILPEEGYLKSLRNLCDEHGILLLFDEVMTGFRVSMSGAAGFYGVTPDLYCFGKVIGGGLPLAAFGGRKEIMELLAPSGSVYQAGTLSGNPLAVKAGILTIQYLLENNPYPSFNKISKRLTSGIKEIADKNGIPIQAESIGSMFGFFFSDKVVRNFEDAKKSDAERFRRFFHLMLDRGVYFAPSAFEAGFIGIDHSEEIIDQVLERVSDVFTLL
ncbi:MAG TPA: glutamate-1-semialdehyde 2,1-aminomutase [Oligoflexia bacterium]|nr:glutamate-1-semialdehyde 2,1-aminomutase [Oligoflexia bacterium]HMP48431.1 glutamate-1-semialdehyde 2,1-aminomutase [Oligoflexia bacterium]